MLVMSDMTKGMVVYSDISDRELGCELMQHGNSLCFSVVENA